MKPEEKIIQLNIQLPPVRQPAAAYVPAKQGGNLLFLSGQGPSVEGLDPMYGKAGKDFTQEEAYQAARRCGLNLLAQAKAFLGSLDKVKSVVKLNGYVNCVPEFTAQPAAINGCSELMEEVFGEAGHHARCAVGCPSLPSDILVEVEMILEVE